MIKNRGKRVLCLVFSLIPRPPLDFPSSFCFIWFQFGLLFTISALHAFSTYCFSIFPSPFLENEQKKTIYRYVLQLIIVLPVWQAIKIALPPTCPALCKAFTRYNASAIYDRREPTSSGYTHSIWYPLNDAINV